MVEAANTSSAAEAAEAMTSSGNVTVTAKTVPSVVAILCTANVSNTYAYSRSTVASALYVSLSVAGREGSSDDAVARAASATSNRCIAT